MKNFHQKGDVINVTAAADITSGQVVAFGHTLGVAATDIATGEEGAVAVEGVFRMPKVSAAEFPIGSKLLWDDSAEAFAAPEASPDEGDILGGATALEAGVNGQTTVVAKLTPGNTTRTA